MNPKIDKSGNKYWYLNGKLHRTDGPAIEYSDGTKIWFLNGKRHRVDGPAVEHYDGYRAWYLSGKLHRIEGPAVEYANGTKYWYLNGKELSEKLFNELARCPYEDLPLMLNKGFDNFISERLKNESRNR